MNGLDLQRFDPKKYYEWDTFVLAQRDGTLFHTSIWLNEQPETETQIFGLYHEGKLVGGTALAVKKRWGQRIVPQPRMTPYYGPVFSDALALSAGLKNACTYLLSQVYARFDAFSFSLPPQAVQAAQAFTAALPDLFPDSTIKPMRTNRICDIEADKLLESYTGSSQRRYIRRASRMSDLSTQSSENFEQLYRLAEESFRVAGRKHPMPQETFIRLAEKLHHHGLANCLMVHFKDQPVAAYWVPFDRHTAYYLSSGLNQSFKNLHAGPYAMHLMIRDAMDQKLVFDFEGSMNETINRYFTSFGPEEKKYVHFRVVASKTCRFLIQSKALRF